MSVHVELAAVEYSLAMYSQQFKEARPKQRLVQSYRVRVRVML